MFMVHKIMFLSTWFSLPELSNVSKSEIGKWDGNDSLMIILAKEKPRLCAEYESIHQGMRARTKPTATGRQLGRIHKV